MFPSTSKVKKTEQSERVRITFCGGVTSVTGANFLVEVFKDGMEKRFLVDCGMEQGTERAKHYNQSPFIFVPSTIDVLMVTHAHMDHIGLIPKLVRQGFRGVIYSTPETRDLSVYMLDDCLKLVTQEAEKTKTDPLFEVEDVRKTFELWKTIEYHTQHTLFAGPEEKHTDDNITVYLKDAGHVLGSSMFEFSIPLNGKVQKFLFTGDLGNSPAPILKNTEKIEGVDYVVMESVYGDRNHEDKPMRVQKLKQAIEDTIERKGVLLIPAFSLEKTQEVLYEINELFEDGHVKEIPMYLDSPLAIRLLPIYEKYIQDYNKQAKTRRDAGDDLFNFKTLKVIRDAEESKSIKTTPNPKIIMAGSGMSTGGRILHHELNYLSDPNTILLFMGFQAIGTLGREIRDGAKEVTIYGHTVKVRAEIRNIDGYSGHKDSDHLISFVEDAAPTVRKVFVTMGESKSALFLVQRLRDYLGVDAIHPQDGDSVTIS